jgi:hypothetical protein
MAESATQNPAQQPSELGLKGAQENTNTPVFAEKYAGV